MRQLYIAFVLLLIISLPLELRAQTLYLAPTYQPMHYWQQLYAINPAAREIAQKRTVTASAAVNNFNADNSTNYSSFITYQHPFKNHLLGFLFKKTSSFQPNITEAALGYSYSFELSARSSFSLGTQLSVNRFFIQREWSTGERFIKFDKTISPDLSAGLQYTRNNFFVGLSAQSIMKTETTSTYIHYSSEKEYQRRYIIMPSYFLTTGYIFMRNKPVEVKSNLLLGTNASRPLIYLNNTVYFKNKVSLGATLQLSYYNAISINVGCVIKQKAEISLAMRPIPNELFDENIGNTLPAFELMTRINF